MNTLKVCISLAAAFYVVFVVLADWLHDLFELVLPRGQFGHLLAFGAIMLLIPLLCAATFCVALFFYSALSVAFPDRQKPPR